MRPQWLSTSLPFASERSAERRCPPAAPLLQQGLGLERRFWAVPPLALPAHFGPAAKEGERAQRKQSRKRDRKVTERVLAQKIWNPHGVCERRSVGGFARCQKGEEKKVNKNHRVWLAGQRAGAVTWTVDYMSCHLAVGFWAAGGTSLGRRNEVNTYVLSLLVWQIYVELSFRYSESAFGANVFKASPSNWPGKPFVSSWRYSRVVHVPQFPYISSHPACLE